MPTYHVWCMTNLKNNRRITSETTLRAAFEAITPEHRKEYVYILKWTPGRFGAPMPLPKYIWGCLCNRVHTNDLRESVRKVLRR